MGLLVTCMLVRPVISADDRILVEGLADAEVWDTGSRSIYLSRDGGDPAAQGRLRLWMAAQFNPRLQGLVLGAFERGDAGGYVAEGGTVTSLEQAWLRYSFAPSTRLVLQAGRMTTPIGNFTRRYLSSQNPLIGSPAGYDVDYPLGIVLTGSAGRSDYLVAMMDQPVSRQIYLPEPSSSFRPALAAGFTPIVGFRVGASATWGPYLAKEVEPDIPSGHSWRDYQQRVVGLDLQFSRGHFELNGEVTKHLFEMPGQHDESGVVYYLEPKYTWSPRFFTALRIERNRTASVWLPDQYNAGWYITDENAWDVEAGAGFRIDPRTVIKIAYRVERTTEYPLASPALDHAIAIQLSFGFDVRSWFERPR